MLEMFKGYKGDALEALRSYKARVWGETVITTTRGTFTGIILPRSESDDDQHIVLKLVTGYNIGIDVDTITGMEEIGYRKANYKIPEKEFPMSPEKRNVKLFGTGGTIA